MKLYAKVDRDVDDGAWLLERKNVIRPPMKETNLRKLHALSRIALRDVARTKSHVHIFPRLRYVVVGVVRDVSGRAALVHPKEAPAERGSLTPET
ncbi:hypothetical protein MTO96_047991 [Rhipicephalus appendiculatus]